MKAVDHQADLSSGKGVAVDPGREGIYEEIKDPTTDTTTPQAAAAALSSVPVYEDVLPAGPRDPFQITQCAAYGASYDVTQCAAYGTSYDVTQCAAYESSSGKQAARIKTTTTTTS